MLRRTPMSQRTPLKQRKPLAKVRAKPRRSEGRVEHGRIKERFVDPTPEQERYWGSLVKICVNCGKGDARIHHILANIPEKEHRRDHWLVVRLCDDCHTADAASVHRLGSEAKFKQEHGTDLVWIAVRNLASWRAAK